MEVQVQVQVQVVYRMCRLGDYNPRLPVRGVCMYVCMYVWVSRLGILAV